MLPAVHMASGIVSGIAATVVTNPFDVAKTRMQLRPLDYHSTLESLWKIAKVCIRHSVTRIDKVTYMLSTGGKLQWLFLGHAATAFKKEF